MENQPITVNLVEEKDMVYLREREKEDPFKILNRFFFRYSPEEFREVIQKWVHGYIISSFQIAQQSHDMFRVNNTSQAMVEALRKQRQFEKALDAAFLIYLQHKEELKKEEETK